MSTHDEVWIERVSESFDEAVIYATKEQIKLVAEHMQGLHENYSLAFGTVEWVNPLERDLKETKKALEIEERKKGCPDCNGEGYFKDGWGRSVDKCYKCNGNGKILR